MRSKILIPLAVLGLLGVGYLTLNAALDVGRPGEDESRGPAGLGALFAERTAVPVGTEMAVRLQSTLSTKTTKPGDRFTAVVAAPVYVDGEVVIPEGARVEGSVLLSEEPGKASGRGYLQLGYEELSFGGQTHRLDTRSVRYESASGTKKDAAMIGGGAVAGGILGGIVGGSAGSAAKGAVVGGAAGTATSLLTRGPQLTLAAGTVLRVRLDRELRVVPPRAS